MAMKYEGGQIVMYELSFQSTPFVDSTKLMLGDPSDKYLTDVDPEGNGFKFIHAARNGVIVSDSNSAYYSRRYLGARRILPD